MRALLAGELTQAQSYASDYYVMLEVQNGSGTWIDVGAALGKHWIVNAQWGEAVDTKVMQATFVLIQAMGAASLSPLMTASALNVDDTLAYSPLLNIGRLVRASVATMRLRMAPGLNSALQSRTLAVAPWSGTTTAAQDAVGLDGLANTATTLTDASAVAFQSTTQNVTIANDSASHTVRFWVKKDAVASRAPQLRLVLSGGTVSQRSVSLNTSTGQFAGANIVGSGTQTAEDGALYGDPLWWVVTITCQNNSTGNTTLSMSVYPAARATYNGADDATRTGSVVIGGVVLQLNSTTAGQFIQTTTVAVSDYRKIFDGRVDNVQQADSLDGVGPITLVCSDLGAWLMDMQIETSGIEYGTSPIGTALETVIQNILDDNIPAGEPAVTLYKQSSSAFAVTAWAQGDTKVLDALSTIVLDSTGEDIRYRYDAAHVSRLTWYNPDRARVTVDATFAPGYTMRSLDLALADIRNAGEMAFGSGVVAATSASSIASFRRRFFRLPASPMLSTVAEAQTVINAVVNDLSFPPGEAAVDIPFFWPVQLYDRYTFQANGRQYDTDQTFAVMGYQHTIEAGRGSTTLTLTSRIVGAYAEWLRRIGNFAVPVPVLTITGQQDSSDGLTHTVTFTVNDVTAEVWAAQTLVSAPEQASDWELVSAGVSPLADGTLSYTITKPIDGKIALAQLEPRAADLTAGAARRIRITATPQVPTWEFDDIEDATTCTQWWKLTPRGIAITTVDVLTQIGSNPVSAFGPPTRGPGDASTVKGGVLGAHEYEHVEARDPDRSTYIVPRATLETGLKVMPQDAMQFDRDLNPNILSVALASGSYVPSILCDSDTKSITVLESVPAWSATVPYVSGDQQVTSGVVYKCVLGHTNHPAPNATFWVVSAAWSKSVNGVYFTPDLTAASGGVSGLGANTKTYTITAYQQPIGYITGSTPYDQRTLTVSGPGAAGPAAAWDTSVLAATAPSVGTDVVTLTLKATGSVVGYTALVYIKEGFASNPVPTVDETSNLSPALTTPPTSSTDYAWSSAYTAENSGGTAKLLTWRARCDLIVGGAVVDSKTVTCTWWAL